MAWALPGMGTLYTSLENYYLVAYSILVFHALAKGASKMSYSLYMLKLLQLAFLCSSSLSHTQWFARLKLLCTLAEIATSLHVLYLGSLDHVIVIICSVGS